MKLGRDTGSFVNYMHGNSRGLAPVVGMGATILLWSDRHAVTITDVFRVGNSPYVRVQEDKAIRVDNNGMSDAQEYRYEPDPNGIVSHFRQDATGCWVEVSFNPKTKRWNLSGGTRLSIGDRDHHYDFSF